MLYVFYGDDTNKVREKVKTLVGQLRAKRPDASVFSFDTESWDEAQFEEMIGAQTLFVGKSIVVGKRILSESVSSEFVTKHLKEIAESDNIFFLEEGSLKKDIVTKLEKKAEKIQEFSLPKKDETEDKEEKNLIYGISNALGSRDKRALWVVYQRLLHRGFSHEEIFWKCSWQLKNMLLAVSGSKAPTAEGLKMNPYVFRNAVRDAKNFSLEELHSLHRSLVVLWHESRRSSLDLGMGLERFILEL